MLRKNVAYGVIILSAMGLVVTYLLYDGIIRFNYPDKEEFPITGIDISHHQGNINWEQLRTEDISFVFIKATEGGDFKDPLFSENWTHAKAEGYATGAYHFYRLCKNGEEQAANFIDTVPIDSTSLPPTVDLEFGGNCATEKTRQDIIKEVSAFLKVIEAHYGKKPIIYATNEFYDQYLVNELQDYPIWIRDIFKRPHLKDGRHWTIWQYANRAHLKGIDAYVDLNVLNGKSLAVIQ